MNFHRLKETLETLYSKYNNKEFIHNDPVEFPHRYKDEEDIILTGFISAIYSYGKVKLFKNVLENIFSHMGSSPSIFLREASEDEITSVAQGNYYRFYTASDLVMLLGIFRNIIRRKRLTDFFEDSFCPDDIISSVLYLRNNLLYEIDNHNCQSNLTKGISFMFPDPKSGSALKRIFMFLRWMVRKDAIDFGILKKIKTSELIIPLDTHTANIGRLLDMTSRKTNDLRCAIEITDFLRKLEPDDPIRYDFAIAHIGITEGCRHSYNKIVCKDCILSAFCDNRQL